MSDYLKGGLLMTGLISVTVFTACAILTAFDLSVFIGETDDA